MKNTKDRVTIYEVAKASGVSLATVSRVINKQDNVTPSTRKKVEETVARLGYKPSALAQALATNRSTNIGVVIPSANYVYISNMLNGITDIAKKNGYCLTLFVTSHSREDALSVVEKVITSHVDGAIIFDDELDVEDVNKIQSYSVPVVCVNNHVEGEKIACVTFGYEHKIRSIINDYFDHGDGKKMYFLHCHNCGRLLARIEKSFIQTHVDANKSYGVLSCDDSYTKTYNDFIEFFKTNKKGYFFAYRDSLAAAITNAAIDSGLNVPEDVEVLSIIGTKYASICRPQLSSMHIDMYNVGSQAMNMLEKMLEENLEEKSCKFESSFIKRGSTK
ncbi:MAG: LacI family DNA-binding transcriptional regulator [Bacilli bacterium]|nr:LacI family DNA-binding transcriptional regulator [Bacilli bacterium]